MRPLDAGRNSMQFANVKVSIACIVVQFEPKINHVIQSLLVKALISGFLSIKHDFNYLKG